MNGIRPRWSWLTGALVGVGVGLVLALLLTRRGSGADGPPSARELAGRLGCTQYEPSTEVVGVREEGTCKLGAAELTIDTFDSSEQQSTITAAFGRLDQGVAVTGDRWRVSAPDAATAGVVRSKLGGR